MNEELNDKEKSENKDTKIPIEGIDDLANEDVIEEPNDKSASNETAAKIEELEKLNFELKDTLLRKVAEFENYKRRTENDQLNLLKYAAESFIKNMLPIYDDLERTVAHVDDENNFEQTKKGILLLFEKFGKALENQGVKRIEAKGTKFDVALHEALMQQNVEGAEPHTVLDVIEQGYIYKDKVIRHAKVIVSGD
ncbi:MAG: nucleotide exchange factor GrpE [Melioribacteraceae bacterium]|nr:nucleotide exchange factor GrpE [Melioribacteraceae bacterium]